MKLLANENFPQDSSVYLKQKGFDVLSVGIEYAGIEDSEVMELAIREDRLILPFDKDYGASLFLNMAIDLHKEYSSYGLSIMKAMNLV